MQRVDNTTTPTPRMLVVADELAEEIARSVVEAMRRVGSGTHPQAMGEVGRRSAVRYTAACLKHLTNRLPGAVQRQARASNAIVDAYLRALANPNREAGV